MARLILTAEGDEFIQQWHNANDYIIAQTSGSTGIPKKLHLPKDDMRQSALATNKYFGINSSSRLVCPLSASFIAGKMMIIRALEADCELIMEPPSNHPLIMDYGSIDLLPIVPSQIKGLVESAYFKKVSNVIVGGAPMSIQQEADLLRNRTLKAYATYGMTETCSHVALREAGNGDYHALPGIHFSTDNRGCLVVNAPKFSFNSLTTNDIVKLIDETSFKWLGRADNVVNSGGIKIFPEELERKLQPHIHQPFYLVGESDTKWGEKLVMKVESRVENQLKLKQTLHSIIKEQLPPLLRPKEIYILPQLSRTSNGKLRRL